MNDLLGSLLRALAGLLHPRVWWLTAAPFVMSALLWGLLFWYGWEWAVARTQHWLGQWPALGSIESAIAFIGLSGLHFVFAPFLVVALAIPLIIATILVVIGATSMPSIVSHLGRRRYAALTPRHGGGFLGSMLHSLSVTAIFFVLMVLSAPLWLIPPFFAILPPVLWGWLTYRVMSYDALAEHATPDERRRLIRRHRWPLVAMGIVTGLLGAVPAMVWASSLIAIVLFPIVAVISIWLYVLIFVFSGLWFTHYCLAALSVMRANDAAAAPL
ncbi:EI24 domain-containing protein [Robbsia sp. Bb-Pol-6]|uniref:EI24 domain-containing protein n=1 Tax=Robbsia betulipollinis TaxID=2981849 RepID=A0ABT3ZIQ0_9BURK|nr:EI24 domain-containing protein [Robbsia betulipollinis]MCY0386386.1 EI24 domain-containing protein [Robbsia betulipollinis]